MEEKNKIDKVIEQAIRQVGQERDAEDLATLKGFMARQEEQKEYASTKHPAPIVPFAKHQPTQEHKYPQNSPNICPYGEEFGEITGKKDSDCQRNGQSEYGICLYGGMFHDGQRTHI